MAKQLSPAQYTRLVHLNRQLGKVLGFEMVAAKRDPATGSFTKASTLTGRSVRAAWGLDPGREAFKRQLLAALRTPRTPRK